QLLDHLIDKTVLLGFFGCHDVVAIGIFLDGLDRLTCVTGKKLIELALDSENLTSLNLDIGCLTLSSTEGLVNQDSRVRQCHSLALGSGREKECAHGGCLSETNRTDIGTDMLD